MSDLSASPTPKHRAWALLLAYGCSFTLGALIDIIRHSCDRIAIAVQSNQVGDAIFQRGLVTGVLIAVVIAGVYWGSRWSGARLGTKQRTGLQLMFIATPLIVYILEH